MSVLWIIGISSGFLVGTAFLLFIVRPKTNSQRMQVIVNTVGLPLTSEIEPTVAATLRREVRAGFLSIAIGISVAIVGMLVAHVHAVTAIFFIDFTTTLFAIGVGSAVATVAQEDARQKSQIRFARLQSVGISDYRAPLEQWLPRVFVVLALAVFAFRVVVASGGIGGTPPFLFVYAGAMLLSLAICEVASRLLVRRGQPAGSALELAWDDALRSCALNAIAIAPFYLGGYFTIASIAFYPISRSPVAVFAVDLSVCVELLFAAGLLAWVIAATARKPQQRYLRRLWPEFASGRGSATPTPAPQA